MEYKDFLYKKSQLSGCYGFNYNFMPDYLFDFQKSLLEWLLSKGRGAIFADCGLGKTIMQLVWCENIARHTNKKVLLLAPLAVSDQTIKEGLKFGIEVNRSKTGEKVNSKIVITNYERLHYFNENDFVGMACDESSILKSIDGSIKNKVIKFMRKLPYRSLWTATAAPNDFIELGSSSEALGELGQMDMLNRFFKNDNNTCDTKGKWRGQSGGDHNWRFKGWAEKDFWRWVCSWARAIRKPSDLGFNDNNFKLSKLIENEQVVISKTALPGFLFPVPAKNYREEVFERKNTIEQRCYRVKELVEEKNDFSVIWAHLNDEGNLLEKIIPDSVQVSGRDKDDEKEEKFRLFTNGHIKRIIIKPKIGAFGLNWQHCNHVITFATHSYEQYYQAVRRCWRFGQKRDVYVDIVLSEAEERIRDNMIKKSRAADKMFNSIVEEMNNSLRIKKDINYNLQEEVPSWLF